MATTTTNLALIKPAGTDKIRIAQINSNMDTLDAKIGAVGSTSLQEQLNNKQGALTFDSVPTSGSTNPVTSGGIYTEAGNLAEAMAILSNNNAHVAISSGQYVYVRGHGTLAEGLYKATAAIAANGTLSTSNLQAVNEGGLNALKSRVDTLISNLKWTNVPISAVAGTINTIICKKSTNCVYISIEIAGPINAYASFLSGFPEIAGMYFGEFMNSDASVRRRFYIQPDGQWFLRESIAEGQSARVSVMVPLNV